MTAFRDTRPPVGEGMRDFLDEGEPALITRVRALRPRRRSRRGLVAGGLVVAVLGGGGVAYARGAVPDFIQRATEDSASEVGARTTSEPTNFVDLRLPDGSRFGAWRWTIGDRLCVASADNWNGTTTGSGGVGCGPDPDANYANVVWAFGRDFAEAAVQPMYPVVFGYVTDHSIAAVRLAGTVLDTGGAVDQVLSVDAVTGGFGAVLPGTVDNTFDPDRRRRMTMGVTLTYLDAAGRSVGPSLELHNGGH